MNSTTVTPETELLVDLLGPLINISYVPDFEKIPSVRYLNEQDIANIWQNNYPNHDAPRTAIDVIKRTLEVMCESKLRMRLIDKKILELVCRAKDFCNIKILSSIGTRQEKEQEYNTLCTELFNKAKELLIACSKALPKINHREISILEDDDFQNISIENYIKDTNNQKKGYRIVFDDDINYGILAENDSSVDHWISGIDCRDCSIDLNLALEDRLRIEKSNDVVNKIHDKFGKNKNWTVLKEYEMKLNGFYVYDDEDKKYINKCIETIENLVKNAPTQRDKPICVFLAGKPGTGKSFFVKCLANFLNISGCYPVTSLSGVAKDKFYHAVSNHISRAFDQNSTGNTCATIAFLDEVDTKGDHLAFRLLMDAMTGTRMDEYGMEKDRKLKSCTSTNLVWIFAGSGGAKREEFIECFKGDELKVEDFFDRIHFDIKLPSTDHPGQVILNFLSALKRLIQPNMHLIISTKVLHLFGQTRWKSSRQIMTICRVAFSKKYNPGLSQLKLEFRDFEDMDASPEFKKAYQELNDHKSCEKFIEIEC